MPADHIHFDLGYFELIDRQAAGDAIPPSLDNETNLVRVSENGVQIITGAWLGTATVEVRIAAEQPHLTSEGWDTVAECSADFEDTELVLTDPTREYDVRVEPRLSRPGLHRVRVHASGRAAYHDSVAIDASAERYLIVVWPVEKAEPPKLLIGEPAPQMTAPYSPMPAGWGVTVSSAPHPTARNLASHESAQLKADSVAKMHEAIASIDEQVAQLEADGVARLHEANATQDEQIGQLRARRKLFSRLVRQMEAGD